MWVTSRQNDPIRTILTHRLKVCRNDVKLSIDWHSLWKVLFLWILWETVSILHEMDQFQVSSIYLIYKSTCLIHDYCNVLLNNLKWSQSVVVCERSVAHIVSVKSKYPLCNELLVIDRQQLPVDKLGAIQNQLLPLINHCSLPWR